jgi:hypothetical protein
MVRLPEAGLITPDLPSDIPPRFEISNEGAWLSVVDLDSPSGTSIRALSEPSDVERLVQDRADRLERLRRILGPIPPALSPKRARKNLAEAIAVLDRGKRRPKNKEGAPGGLVELPDDVVPIMVGDLHAEVDNLILVLIEGRTLDRLESGDAALLILGDAVHPEDEEALAEMGSSLLMTDMIARLMVAFPSRVFYLRGNHDSFSEDMTKGGISQGLAWREAVKAHRGKEGVAQMQEFYDRLPYVAVGKGFIACHAGPPRGKVSRKALINVTADSSLMHQLTWNRVQTPRHPGGYTKRDVRGLQKALDHPKSSVLVVSHNPGRDGDTTIRSLGGIKHHDLVYSAKPDRVSIMTRFEGRVVPITYPGSLLLEALAGLPKP